MSHEWPPKKRPRAMVRHSCEALLQAAQRLFLSRSRAQAAWNVDFALLGAVGEKLEGLRGGG